jgi:hypothetical protein
MNNAFVVQHTKTGKNIPNDHTMYQMAIIYTKWLSNIPNGHKIYQHFPFQCPPKHIKFGIFGMKIFHLATLSTITKTWQQSFTVFWDGLFACTKIFFLKHIDQPNRAFKKYCVLRLCRSLKCRTSKCLNQNCRYDNLLTPSEAVRRNQMNSTFYNICSTFDILEVDIET